MPGSPTPPGHHGPPVHPVSPQAGPGYPAYPAPPGPPEPKRNRATLFVVLSLVGFLVAAAALTGVYLATSGSGGSAGGSGGGSGEGAGDRENTSPAATLPAVRLPAGCSLLAEDQFRTFVPGELEEPQETAPADWGEGSIRVSCDWRNVPVYGEVPHATLQVQAFSSSSESLAKANMTAGPGKCGDRRPAVEETTVPGADEACLIHAARIVDTNEFVENVHVVARAGTVVVAVYYYHAEAQIEEIDMVGRTMASAALATIREQT